MEKQREIPNQRATTLPPLNLQRYESESSRPKATESNASSCLLSIIEASQTIIFTSSSLHRAVNRCLTYLNNDSLLAIFSPTLYKLRTATEKLSTLLDMIEKRPSSDLRNEILQAASNCIAILKDLCWSLRTRLSILAQGLDKRCSRNLLLNLYGATVDIKDAWETIRPHLSVHPSSTLHPLQTKLSTPVLSRDRSQSEVSTHSTSASPLTSPHIRGDNSQLYLHLRNAVANSLHVLNSLKQFVEETIASQQQISASLEQKLHELLRQTQYATDLSNRLDSIVEANMGQNKDEFLLLPTRQEASRRIWEDTSIYLKAIVSVMTSIRLIQTEEEFAWSKSIKQGCLYVTRMTAEVAKMWNTCSTFAEDGFFLGRQERSASVSESSLPSPATDIPIQRTNNE